VVGGVNLVVSCGSFSSIW